MSTLENLNTEQSDARLSIPMLKAFFNWYVEFNPAVARVMASNIRYQIKTGDFGLPNTPDNLQKIRQAILDGFYPDLTEPTTQKPEVSSSAANTGDSAAQ
jgi:hypothetical protein